MKKIVGSDKESAKKCSSLLSLDRLVFIYHVTVEKLVGRFPVFSPPQAVSHQGHTYRQIHSASNGIFESSSRKKEYDDTYSSTIIVVCFLSE